jgi:hypothetical protein
MVFIFVHAVNKRAVLDMSWPRLVLGAEVLAEDESLSCTERSREPALERASLILKAGMNYGRGFASGLDRILVQNFLAPQFDPPFAATSCKNGYDGTKSDFVAILQLSVSDKDVIDLCSVC